MNATTTLDSKLLHDTTCIFKLRTMFIYFVSVYLHVINTYVFHYHTVITFVFVHLIAFVKEIKDFLFNHCIFSITFINKPLQHKPWCKPLIAI